MVSIPRRRASLDEVELLDLAASRLGIHQEHRPAGDPVRGGRAGCVADAVRLGLERAARGEREHSSCQAEGDQLVDRAESDHRDDSAGQRADEADDGEHPDGAAPGDGEPACGAGDAQGDQNEQQRGHVPEDQEDEGDDDRDGRGQSEPGGRPSRPLSLPVDLRRQVPPPSRRPAARSHPKGTTTCNALGLTSHTAPTEGGTGEDLQATRVHGDPARARDPLRALHSLRRSKRRALGVAPRGRGGGLRRQCAAPAWVARSHRHPIDLDVPPVVRPPEASVVHRVLRHCRRSLHGRGSPRCDRRARRRQHGRGVRRRPGARLTTRPLDRRSARLRRRGRSPRRHAPCAGGDRHPGSRPGRFERTPSRPPTTACGSFRHTSSSWRYTPPTVRSGSRRTRPTPRGDATTSRSP